MFFKLYWSFYKSTVILNICVSFAVACFVSAFAENFFAFGFFFSGSFATIVLLVFPGSFATIGFLAVFLYKEIACSIEYYFFYNRGITKIKLFIFCLLVNLIPATLILSILYHVAST